MEKTSQPHHNKEYVPYLGILSQDQIIEGAKRFRKTIKENREKAIEIEKRNKQKS